MSNSLKKLYLDIYENLQNYDIEKIETQEGIINIISIINHDENYELFINDQINFEQLSSSLRNYEDCLSDFFFLDKELFELKFNLYIYFITTLKTLCRIYSFDLVRKNHIEPIMEMLIESKNILKFRIQLNKEKLNILNDHIGEERYKFSHISSIKIKTRTLDNIFQIYILNAERMIHGFELSDLSNFGNKVNKNPNIEKNILINNLSFLLLKMIYKISKYHTTYTYDNHKDFTN